MATWCEELTHWKRPWCWDRLKAGGKGGDTGWDGWMGSPTWWTWIWVSSGSWWWTGKPGVLQSMESKSWTRLRDRTELNSTNPEKSNNGVKLSKYNRMLEYLTSQPINKINKSLFLFLCKVLPDSLWPHGLQHASLPCPSPTPGACSNSCPLSQWCYLIISSSAALFSFCPQPFPASRSFPMSQFFTSGGHRVLSLQLQNQSFQWIFRVYFLEG